MANAWYLERVGNQPYISIPNYPSTSVDGDFDIEFLASISEPSLDNYNYGILFATSNFNRQEIALIGNKNQSVEIRLRNKASNEELISSVSSSSIWDVPTKFRISRSGGVTSFFINDTLEDTSLNAIAFDQQFNQIFRQNNGGAFNNFNIYYLKATIYGDSREYKNNVNATQTVYPELLDNQDGTLVNFTSPPPWVLYDDGGGGGALEIDPPLVGATAVVPSLEVSVSPALDIPVISSEAVVFESEFLTGLPLEVPRVQGTPFVYEFSILESGEVVLEVVGSETDVFSYEIIGQQVIDIGETGGIPEVYTFTLVKPQQIQVDRTDGTTNVLTFVVSDQNGIVIPLEDRETLNRVAAFLRTAGFEGTTNEVILQWLLEEGYDGQINDVLYKYWGDLGLAGCFNDKNETWKRG